MVNLGKLLTTIGLVALTGGIYLASPLVNRTYPLIENNISKSERLPERIKNHKPKRILYLISEDFKFDYNIINEKLKAKLRSEKESYAKWGRKIQLGDNFYRYEGKKPSNEQVAKLENIIQNFNLDEKVFEKHLGDLNLFKADEEPYLVRENEEDCEVLLRSFKDEDDFFGIFLDENINNIDEVIIYSHGHKGFLFPDTPVKFFEFTKFFNPKKHITVKDITKLSPEKLEAIRSKFNNGAVGYVQSCQAMKDSDKRTTITEALSYLFQTPIIASKILNSGWCIDVNPYDTDKVDMSRPETITSENMSFMVNYNNGDWTVVMPKTKKSE